jgi:hypothetical protein
MISKGQFVVALLWKFVSLCVSLLVLGIIWIEWMIILRPNGDYI